MTLSNKISNGKKTLKFILKNHTSNEEDKSQDGARKDSITKKRRQSKRAKIEDEISRRKLIQKLKEKRESFDFSSSRDEKRVNEKIQIVKLH